LDAVIASEHCERSNPEQQRDVSLDCFVALMRYSL
jgi:hypothetical protein